MGREGGSQDEYDEYDVYDVYDMSRSDYVYR